ncbi:MAG: hypothetical protein CSA66_00380 [Proteobacteria bacterium]|nr:MAG: hypothetical protein CSA66_00380 [Pseudomonadota bacterium]
MKKDEIELQPVKLPGGGRSIIGFSRPLWLHGADPKRPLRLEVTVDVEAPDAQGMPEGAEADQLDDLEFLLVKAAKKARGEHAMKVTGAARVVHVFYLPAKVGAVRKRDPRQVVTPAVEAAGAKLGRALSVEWTDDPQWRRLLGIFSAHDPAQWQQDRALMIHMAKANDAIHARRQVGHRVYFDARERCAAFLREARQQLKLRANGGPKRAPAGAPGKLLVTLERLEPTVAVWHLHPVVLSIKAIAAKHGGVYDGWETELIPSLVPPPLTPPSAK